METIDTLNARLIDYYGIDTCGGGAMYRIVWANDEREYRRVDTLDSGIQLPYSVVREVKKYPYLKDLYVLERLVLVPEAQQNELPASKLSYEPLWAYRDAASNPIAPVWIPTQFIIDTLHAALGKTSLRKYVEPEGETTPEGMDQRITKLCEELFGNESETGDAMAYGEAIVVPQNYDRKKES